ncbi:MAG: hypothetical protein AB7V55_00225 [Oscillospiraceae bacterium]
MAEKTLQKPAGLKVHWLVFLLLAGACFAVFMHTDVMETANHSYLLLECLFGGKFRSFYGEVAAHTNSFYYINNAHYNIVVYLLFAAFELPVYLVNTLFHLPPNEVVLSYVGKAVSALFFAGCLALVYAIARQMGLGKSARWAPLFTALCPPAFFSVFVMGQYDTICLFFTLLALWFWMRGRWWAFALVFGLAIPFKVFAALLFVPLLLLAEKRPLHILKYGMAALWLVVPTGLLFAGHTFSMVPFNSEMMRRLFASVLPAGREVPVFALCYGLLCIFCYLWRPPREALPARGVFLALAVYGLLFLFVEWHPQWLVLLAPFLVLTTLAEHHRGPFVFIDLLLCAGFFLVCAAAYPGQVEANLFNHGLLGLASGARWELGAQVPLITRYTQVEVIRYLPTLLFTLGLAAHLIFKLPLRSGTPASRLLRGTASGTPFLEAHPAAGLWLVFGVGFGVFWLLPTCLGWAGIL